jgi:hypothetical protein
MANELKREPFVGKYDGVNPPLGLPPGSLQDGRNVRKIPTGGWKARKGCVLHNTTAAESGASVKSLHCYKNPRQNDWSFIAQCNSKLLKATNVPPAAGTTLGTELQAVGGTSLAGTTPGFSDQVGEYWFYADGSGGPVVYGGLTPFPKAFLNYDVSEREFIDHTRMVTDGRSDTSAIIVLAIATDLLYLVTEERISAVTIDFGTTVNSEEKTLTVAAMRGGSYTNVSDQSDGTVTGSATFTKDGTISWTASANDTPTVVGGYFGYSYRFTFSGALTVGVQIVSLKVTQPAARVTNKWHGVYEYISGCRFFDSSLTEYIECLGKVSTESTALYIDVSEATTDDFLYIKTPEPACGFGIAPVPDYENTADAQVDLIECLEGDTWTDISTFTDTTLDTGLDSSFAHLGFITFDTSGLDPTKRTLQGDSYPGYWYRISWDATLSADTRIYLVVYATAPLPLPAYDGCTEFKSRLALWGDPEFPNRIRFSQYRQPFAFTGSDAGYSEVLGFDDKILVAKKFYSELIVWKASSIWLLEGYNMQTFGTVRITSHVGIASPKTAQVVEAGYSSIHADEPKMIAIWQEIDGVYVFDGRKPMKVSAPVEHYFNPEFSTCIAAADIRSLDSFVDYSNNEYHLLLPAAISGVTELVYNYISNEWYPPWSRAMALTCGTFLRGMYTGTTTFERFYAYAGTASGIVVRLENDTTDKSAANADVAITHYIKPRAIGVVDAGGLAYKFALRRVFLEAKARASGTLTTTFYRDRATSGTTIAVPAALSLVNTDYSIAYPKLDLSQTQLACFEIVFTVATADCELEAYAILYEIEVQGLLLPT